MKLMTQYDWAQVAVPGHGTFTYLVELKTRKHIQFYIADPLVSPARIGQHMDSITDDQCEQFFQDTLSKEEIKARNAARKEQARKERAELEAKAKIEEERLRILRAEEKAAAKAAKAKRA